MMLKGRKNRWLLIALLGLLSGLLAFFLLRGGPGPVYGVNLLKNGDFEALDEAGMPRDWLSDAYNRAPGVSEFVLSQGYEGQGVLVRNLQHNDARFMQAVAVHPNTIYELSGWVKADVLDGRGANLSVADVYGAQTGLLDTLGEWQQFTAYGKTIAKQTELTIYVRLGGYSADSQGEALFDNISFKALQAAPAGVDVDTWQVWQPEAPAKEAGIAQPAWPYLLLITLLWLAFGSLMAFRLERQANLQQDGQGDSMLGLLLLLLLTTFIVRLGLAWLIPGYAVDIGCFTGWANQMARVGPADFYLSDIYSDYPPGYMLVLWPIGLLGQLFGTGASSLMVKLPAMLCDLLAVVALYRFAAKRMNPRAALWLAVLYALNPLILVTGSAWGQVDSVPTLLLLLVLIWALEGKWRWSLPLYVLAVLMKPQALMFGPLGLVALVVDLWGRDRAGKWRDLGLGLALSLLTALLVVLPFSLKQGGLAWLVELYAGTMNLYAYATVNATNLHFLFGLNWQPVTQAAPFLLRLVGGLALMLPTLWYLYGGRLFRGDAPGGVPLTNEQRWLYGLALLSALAQVLLPLSLSLVGTLLMVSTFLLVLISYVRAKSLQHLPLLGAVLLILFCELGVMMHERYLFPAVLLLMMAYAIRRDRSLLWLILGLSALTFLNVAIVLDRAIRIGGVAGHLSAPLAGISSDSEALEYLVAALHVLLAAFALHVGLQGSHPGRPAKPAFQQRLAMEKDTSTEPLAQRKAMLRLLQQAPTRRMEGKDWLIVGVVTVLYAVLALSNLGAHTAPETGWLTEVSDETVIFDLGRSHRFKLLYYPGIQWADNDIQVAVSDDMGGWQGQDASLRPGDCFAWRYQTEKSLTENKFTAMQVVHEGRYLRLTAPFAGTSLLEIIARDADSGQDIPLKLTSGSGEALIDEQDRLQGGEPSWYNSAYFDEIYHARTGYEQANALRGLSPSRIYETSHPPLGKLFISLSILIFGMNPFGWRFAGALAGVLMLPGMYLMARLLSRRRLFASAAMLLMALDSMHFAQTRIATIDSFVTLFIIWAYYFMLRFALQGSPQPRLGKTMLTLFFSGLFMGLAIASKWTGMYAGLGLAVIFFMALWRRVQDGLAAEALMKGAAAEEDRPTPAHVAYLAKYWRVETIGILASCVISFVLVPLVIYYYSFLPVFMQTAGGLSIKKVVDASTSMLNYHATPGLGMDHYYYSPWYEWPLMIKPMWFYSGARLEGTGSSIATFGNLAVWWGGLAALFMTFAVAIRRWFAPTRGQDQGLQDDIRPWLIIIAFSAQYLPWIPVPRGTYIYHYFPSLPFIILSITLMFSYLSKRAPKLATWLCVGFLVLAAALFVAFFPYASGLRVSTDWLSAMQWFNNWLHY